ncbi:MAG TPA: SPFH domain-containing protein, partial [Luteolibacter sp.]|nr:SPFH domain-containing protein [Luteolibacter sp.]
AGILCAFFGILSSLGGNKPSPVHAALGRFAVILHFVSGGVLLAAPYSPLAFAPAIAWFFTGLGVILVADTFLKLVSHLYTPRTHRGELAAPGAYFFFGWFGKDRHHFRSSAASNEDSFSLKLPEMWMWPALRSGAPLIVLCAIAICWSSTAFHEIKTGFSGVRHSAGVWENQPLASGFHLSLPWPLGGIRTVDTGRIHETVLGFRADPGKPILWERAHYDGEQLSLVGGGDDFLSISVPIHYRIADPASYLRGAADPDRLVRDAGSRILLDLTLQRSAAAVMTSDRENIRLSFHDQLQAALDHDQTGIRIEQVCLRDVHPAVEVAPSFQEVFAAMEEKEAMLHEGESYHRDFTARSQSDAYAVVVTAKSDAANRLAKVNGESIRFDLRRKAWDLSPSLFELREGFRFFDDTLSGAKKAIFDDRIRSVASTQIDLRKVLNPDLIDNSPPAPSDGLVPRPSKSRDAYDLDIEGFLRTDRGEIPAVQATPADPDNLLKPNVPNP